MFTRRIAGSTLAVTISLLLGACSGSDYDDDPAPPAPPPAPPAAPTPGDTFALTSANRLITFNRASPALRTGVAITGLQANENVLGIDIRPGGTPGGEIYALGSTGRIYTVNAGTGAATLKSTLAADPADTTSPFAALDGAEFGVDFNPVVDRLRVASNTGQNLRINVDTGATITDGGLNHAGLPRPGVSAAAYTNSFASACRTVLFFLDTNADRFLSTSDPNSGTLTDIGALGVNGDGSSGFEIVTASDGTNTALTLLSINTVPTLHTVNLATGTATANGAVTGLNAGETLRGLAVAPPTAAPTQAVGNVLGVSESNRLISFTNAAPQKLCTSAPITGLQASEGVLGIDTRPADGALYALGSTGRLYTVNATSGAATLKSTLTADAADATSPFTALDGATFGVDFNPVPDRLRMVSDTGQNLRINVDSGATTTDATLNPVGSAIAAAAYTNSFASAGTTTLYGVDVTNDRLVIQGQPSGNPNNGDLLAVGALGVGDVQTATGFDINGVNSMALAALNLAGAATSELHTVNLTTGAATRVNTIGGGERVRGLAFAANPQATVFGVTDDHRLVSFKAMTAATLDTNVPISGLQGGEAVVGIDVRPANGRLYALTDAGRLYTLDAATGAAAAVNALFADAADATNPFTAFMGGAFGVDFNPTVDRLRTVSDAGQNLRSNADSGATTTDATLNRAPFAVTAAAYTNSFAGTAATTLFVIDTQNDRLLTQNPPNNGTLNEVGALGLDVTAVNGFEIVGPDTAVAALSTAAAPTGFYSLNLTTGVATLIGNIALPQAADRITGITGAPSMATPAADSTLYAAVNGLALTSFARNAPANAAAPTAIAGLQAGETVLGLDFRPASGVLYALGSSGQLYTLDPATAVATAAGMLAADPADATDPFMALAGTNFGVDFNPVADRLRVVSDTGQNLRINVATAGVTTDGTLNFAPPAIVAAAYTQSFAGASATRLLGIDIATSTLQVQSPPNDGVLATIGRLDPMLVFGIAAGFDIAGGDDGLSLAALVPSGAVQSTLYRVNVRTGAATVVGSIGPTGTQPLRALAIRLQ